MGKVFVSLSMSLDGFIAAAIEDAEGITIRRMPISPSELFALRSRKDPS